MTGDGPLPGLDAADLAAGRSRADVYKARLRKHVARWLKEDRDPASVVAALGETTADVGCALTNPSITAEMFRQIARQIDELTQGEGQAAGLKDP